ncbi:Nse1 non-SMC component of SMC5-6 complex-domain-containing protein [Mucidula mucida]|nr:Nse1 non-SMC component of SMC5-6 complex-domain-containing protein [Mucidula mucida]
MASAGDVQRLFLQAVLSRGVISEKLARVLRKKCVAAVKAADSSLDIAYSDSDASWEAFIANVNKSLDALDISFKFAFDEVTGKKMCILANMKSDEIAQLATEYSVGEIAYFRNLVEQIMLAPRDAFSVSSFAALRELKQIKPTMSQSQGEKVLASFVTNGWLVRSKRGRYSLSLRSTQELAPYLKDNFPKSIYECTICHEMVTKGVGCHRPNCQVHLHLHCFKNVRTRRGTCPSCSIDWPRNANDQPLIPIGENAARDGDERTRRVETKSDEESDRKKWISRRINHSLNRHNQRVAKRARKRRLPTWMLTKRGS